MEQHNNIYPFMSNILSHLSLQVDSAECLNPVFVRRSFIQGGISEVWRQRQSKSPAAASQEFPH